MRLSIYLPFVLALASQTPPAYSGEKAPADIDRMAALFGPIPAALFHTQNIASDGMSAAFGYAPHLTPASAPADIDRMAALFGPVPRSAIEAALSHPSGLPSATTKQTN
jgi:hypothetical protein